MRILLRIFFWLLGIALVGWIGYMIYDMTNWKNNLLPEKIFCSKDEKVLVIHRPNSFEWGQFEFPTLNENKAILDPILSNLESNCHVYLSKKRNLILLENQSSWNKSSIQQLLEKSKLRFSFQEEGIKIEQFNAYFKNNKLLIYKYEEDIEGQEFNWGQLDRNSSASIVSFEKSVVSFVDIFVKNENTIEFHSKNANGIKGRVIDEVAIFQAYIPSKSKGYQFYERDYLGSIDASFKNSPIFNVVETGIVGFQLDGKSIFLCDFKEGQNLVQNLNEYFQRQEDNTMKGNYENIVFSDKIGLSKGNYFIETIDDMAIISSDESAIELIKTEIESGKVWLYNEEEIKKNFKDLPQSVSYRSFGQQKNSSISVLGDKIIQTEVKYKPDHLKINTDLEYLSVSINGKIQDFVTFSGRGNLVCLTENGDLIGIENGVKTWKKNLGEKAIGGIQVVKSGKTEFLVLNTSKSIHTLSRFGKYQIGYPVNISGFNITCPANAFILKDQISVGIVNQNNELLVYNSSGERSKLVQIPEKDSWQQLDFFARESKLCVLLKGENKICVYNVDKKELIESFDVSPYSMVCDIPNSSLLFYPNKGFLKYWKYGKSKIENNEKDSLKSNKKEISSDIVINTKYLDSASYVISKSRSMLIVSKNESEILLETDFGNSSISFSDIFMNSFEELYFAVADGAENKLYLYDGKGKNYVKGFIEGTKKVSLNQTNGFSLTVTTIIDGYIVQYLIK